MIHYHGTPISGSKQESVRFLTGRHALVSFAAPSWIDVVSECCASFVLDNGAFTTWRQGKEHDFDGFVSWVAAWAQHPGFDWALIPDSIDGTEEQNDGLLAQWPLPMGVPVWHLHESLDRLDRLVCEYARVALGSSGSWPSPNTHGWWERMGEAMSVACDDYGRPRAKLHGLRMLDPEVFTRIPLSSADSTNAGVNAGSPRGFGYYVAPSPGLRAEVIASRIEASNSSPTWDNRQERLCDTLDYISLP